MNEPGSYEPRFMMKLGSRGPGSSINPLLLAFKILGI